MAMSKHEQILHAFTYHAPLPESVPKFEKLRERGRDLASLVAALVPDGREQSVALTKIEEAIFWANAGIARNQKPTGGS